MAGWGALVAVCGLLVLPAMGQEAPQTSLLPDASQAQIEGRVAVGMWPSEDGVLLDAELFTVHLADDSRLERQFTYPVATWFQPPPGRYKVWVEGAGRVSPSYDLLTYSGRPFRGRGLAAVHEVAPAGEVAVHPDVEWSERSSLRLLSLEATNDAGRLTRGFLRAIGSPQETVLLPRGRGVGFLYDRQAEEYLAASRPFEVGAEGTVRVRPATPRGVSDLFVVLHRPAPLNEADEDDLKLSVIDGEGRTRPADVYVGTWEWIYALWYGLDQRSVVLETSSERVFLDPAEIALRPGRVETFRGELLPLPFVDVRLDLPDEIVPRALDLRVRTRDLGSPITERALPLDRKASVRLDNLPATELTLSLSIDSEPGWTLKETVDLSDGQGREVVFRADPIRLSGRVYLGDEPTAATVRIGTDRNQPEDRLVVEADEDGFYEAIMRAPGRYPMRVDVAGQRGPGYRVHFPPFIRDDTELDVHIPLTSASVEVIDADTRRPIRAALVVFDLEFDKNGRRATTSQAYETDDAGVARLPPLPPGELLVHAEADRYFRSERMPAQIVEDRQSELTIELQPMGETTQLELRLPGGAPASGAELRAQYAAWNELPVWQGRADVEGRVDIPLRVTGAWLAVRHPDAGAWIQGWDPQGEPSVSWQLPAAAGALVIRSVGPDGRVVPGSALAVRLPACWVAGRTLAWLAGTAVGGTDAGGVWRSERLPEVPLLVAAGSVDTVRLALQGFIDGSAVRLTAPWPAEPVDIRADLTR